MRWLSDDALDRLRSAADVPDLSGTRYVLIDKLVRAEWAAFTG